CPLYVSNASRKSNFDLRGIVNHKQIISVDPEVPVDIDMGEIDGFLYAQSEYAVALFQYLRLNGYNPNDISILCDNFDQFGMIRTILEKRCNWTDFCGRPSIQLNPIFTPSFRVIASVGSNS